MNLIFKCHFLFHLKRPLLPHHHLLLLMLLIQQRCCSHLLLLMCVNQPLAHRHTDALFLRIWIRFLWFNLELEHYSFFFVNRRHYCGGEKGDGDCVGILLFVNGFRPFLTHGVVLIGEGRDDAVGFHSVWSILFLTDVHLGRNDVLCAKQGPPDIIYRAFFMLIDPQLFLSVIANTLIRLVM